MTNHIELLEARVAQLEAENAALKQKQLEVNQAKELYLKIFEEFPALIWRSRLDKLCDYFNKTWLEFTGRSMEQEFGNGWAENVHPEDFDRCLKTYVEAFDRQEAFLMEYRMTDRFGRYRWIRDFGRPFYDLDNSFLGYIGSCYDITENKDNEQKLIALNATKDKLFSIIAHDLRTPLINVLSFVELLNMSSETLDETKKKEIGKQLFHSTKSAFAMLDNLLEWSRSQVHQITFNPQSLDFNAIFREVMEPLQVNANAKSISIFNNASGIENLFADIEMFRVVLRNLLSNAIKYTKPNGIINVYIQQDEQQTSISIADNGIGISPEKQSTLFDVSPTQSTRGTANEKGTGLGLVICREFVEQHGGKIWVESTLGLGSDFIFTLPLEKKTIKNVDLQMSDVKK